MGRASASLLLLPLLHPAAPITKCVFRRDLGADSGGTWAVIPE
jgi:hypothetical protein